MVRMARIVHQSKGLFGETIYTDEHFRLIGTSRKGLFGEEVFLDRNMKYVGSKQKGLFGEDVYLDQDFRVSGYGWKSPGDTKIYTDQDGHYAGWGGKGLGSDEMMFLDGERSGEHEPVTKRGVIGGLIFLGMILGVIVWFISAVLR